MGKVIECFLVDDTFDGRIQITGRTLLVSAIKVPRDKISARFEDLDKPGVYVLLSDKRAYIGQASLRVNNKSFTQRWCEHIRAGRDWWDKAIAFISNSADGFDATDLDWLESELIRRAKECGSYEVDNGNQPTIHITSRKRAVLEDVMESIRFILTVMNYPKLLGMETKPSGNKSRAQSVEEDPFKKIERLIAKASGKRLQNRTPKPKGFEIGGVCFEFRTWRDATISVCNMIADRVGMDKFKNTVLSAEVFQHRTRCVFGPTEESMRGFDCEELDDGLWVLLHFSANDHKRIIGQIVSLFPDIRFSWI